MNLAIIGAGKIGTMTASKLGYSVDYHDPYKGMHIDDFSKYEYVFVCVDTVQTGPEDYRDLDSALSNLKNYNGVVIIRSTISPEKAIEIEKDYSFNLSLFPEFWPQRENALILDDSWITLVGGSDVTRAKVKGLLLDSGYFSDENTYRGVTNKEAAIIKLSANAILATKVTMFNVIKSICDSFESDYSNVRNALMLDKRLGAEYHSTVPSPDDGLPGFGGHCLPKDIKAIGQLDAYEFFNCVDLVNKKLGR